METDIRDYSAFAHKAGMPLKPVSDDKELREKALMYAVQTYGPSLDGLEIVGIAEGYLDFLRGDGK